MQTKENRVYAIYGDNIVECERMLAILKRALCATTCTVAGSAVAPTFLFQTPSGICEFRFYPGFDRWEHDIVAMLRSSGGILRETPDVYITAVQSGEERPVLAIEFCSALPAGNQAWQRSGRAYSTARCGIPYLFITEIGGYELTETREKKAPRLPNPAVPFSFISYAATSHVDAMIAYAMNPGADRANKEKYTHIVAGSDLLEYIAAKLNGTDSSAALAAMGEKVFSFVCATSEGKRTLGKSLNREQWESAYRRLVRTGDENAIYHNFDLPWHKKISIQTKRGFGKFQSAVEKLANGIGSVDLPFAIVRREYSAKLINVIKSAYPKFFKSISEMEFGDSDIAICLINGFKPRGDDARPERGILPLLRMLVGDKIKILTVVYGPATVQMVDKLENAPRLLANENGLWESVLALSNYVICDSPRVDHYVCLRGWGDRLEKLPNAAHMKLPENENRFPMAGCVGENDVDSVIHMLFAHVLKNQCFESMCNPPGGDWSGISLVFGNKEYRWLTLPRVSATKSKRPDHVIQIREDLVITIESKDYLRNLEKGIGPRLNRYCADLFSSIPSCVRLRDGEWHDDTDGFKLPAITYVSVGAFIETSPSDCADAINHAKTDVIFSISFTDDVAKIRIKFGAHCPPDVKALLSGIVIPDNLKMEVELLG